MYGEKTKKLIRELKTSTWLPPFNSGLIDAIQTEIKELYEQISTEFNSSREDVSTMLYHLIASRDKRGVLVYLNHRLNKLEQLKWESGSVIPSHFAKQLHSDELEYFTLYNNLISSYSAKVSTQIDIANDLDPPKDIYISVRVEEQCGEIVLPESGVVALDKDTVHLLKRTEAAPLVRQGVLNQIL